VWLRMGPEDPGDALIPQQPIGRLVTKGDIGALEYDPIDAPEFVPGEFGGGEFSWEPLTPEGGLLDVNEDYDELTLPVPVDRLDYLIGAGYLEAQGDEDYRAYVDDEVTEFDGREWQNIVLRGKKACVKLGQLRLMEGVTRRRPWELLEPEVAPAAARLPAAGKEVQLPTKRAAEGGAERGRDLEMTELPQQQTKGHA